MINWSHEIELPRREFLPIQTELGSENILAHVRDLVGLLRFRLSMMTVSVPVPFHRPANAGA